ASPLFSGLAPGTYSITKKRGADGCVSPAKTVVINPAPAVPPMPAVTVVQPTCTTPTGTITVIAPVGYLFSIDGVNYQASPVFSGLAAGTYNVTKKTTEGCVSPAKVVVINPTPDVPPMPTVTVVQPSCTTPTGTITVIAPVGYLFSIDGVNYQTSPVFSGLAPGTYSVTKKYGAGGCVSPAKTVVLVQASAVPMPTVSVVQPGCDKLGMITVTSPVGTGYAYSINGGPYQVSPQFAGLAAGNYQVRVKNAAGCLSPAYLVVLAGSPLVPQPVVQVGLPGCGCRTGAITVISPLGWQYSYSIDGVNYQSSPTFPYVAPGTYYVTVRQFKGCVSASTKVVISTAGNSLYAKSGCVNVYPNPFTEVINFSFVPAETGKAKIEIFDLYGRKLATAFEGEVVKQTRVDVRYNVALPMRVPVIYRITTASGVESGKLLPAYSTE
ncbi:MAG TPA: hypothetical protein VF145_02340, partial [Chitinophagaceae bacterium]